ncbi:MAG: hypothetical protein ACR2LS_02135 [Thermomicrobiales bacterium]
MRITSVETAVVQGNVDWVLVRIETDAGDTGIGEAYWGVGVAELVHKAAPLLIGEDPFNVGKLYEMMTRCMSGEGSLAGATVTAISGIELALWDLVGRALKMPISTMPIRAQSTSRTIPTPGAGGWSRATAPPARPSAAGWSRS